MLISNVCGLTVFKKDQRSTIEILKIKFFVLKVRNFYVKSIFDNPEVPKITVMTFLGFET